MNIPPDVPEVTTQDLAHDIESGESLQILDVRAPHRLTAGTIDLIAADRFHNLPGSQLLAMSDPAESGLDPNVPVAVVCGNGNSSKQVTAWLNERGFAARSVRGGMAAWMLTLAARPLPALRGLDQLIQFDRLGKGSLSYALISEEQALVVDPPRHTEGILAAIADAGARLVAVADTHAHADYISGAPGLSAQYGVPYYLHPADTVYPYDGRRGSVTFTAAEDGLAIPFGAAQIGVMHTPGHTEGSVTYLLDDQAALTGDFIFVLSIGRPDLAGRTAEWTTDLWRSLERARAEWGAEREILPAHYTSEAERRDDRSIHDQWGRLQAENEVLGIQSLDEFRIWIDARVGDAPEAYRTIKAINVGLKQVTEQEADVLEVGKSECAVG